MMFNLAYLHLREPLEERTEQGKLVSDLIEVFGIQPPGDVKDLRHTWQELCKRRIIIVILMTFTMGQHTV